MNKKVILGIDEVGRGPWAGPLVVGAVILGSSTTDWSKLNDSKKLTARKRTELNQIILSEAAATGLGWVDSKELDKYGLSASLKLATRRAVKQVLATKSKFDEIIIDGTVNFLKNTPLEQYVTTMKKADAMISEVSAASIIAKVARDNYMIKISQQYPQYGFEQHVGYGTAKHQAVLLQHGICPEHRQSFKPIQKIIIQTTTMPKQEQVNSSDSIITPELQSRKTSTAKGKLAENVVADYLRNQGHSILMQNFKTKTCEIDIVSIKSSQIFFTEVKYSQNIKNEGTPLIRITAAKKHQMYHAAEVFLLQNPHYCQYEPLLAAASVSGEDFMLEEWFVLDE